MASRIPLDLFHEVTTASGARYKWDANQPRDSRLQNFSFRTKIGEGFSDASGQLARRIDQDYPDLNLVDSVVVTGADGSVAYEGRVAAMPRDLSDRHSIGVTLAGWIAHAKDRKFQEIYVDRDIGQWGSMPIEHQAAVLAGGISLGDLSYTAEQGGLTCAFPTGVVGSQSLSDTWYQAPPGCTVGLLVYQGVSTSLPGGWAQRFGTSDTRVNATTDTYTPTLDDTLRAITPTTARRYITHQTYSNGTGATPAAGAGVRLSKLAVYGSHGLTTRLGDSTEPNGLYGSDVIRDIVSRFCPALNTAGVQDTTYVIQHLAFRDPTYAYDALLEINKFHLWHLGVWDNRTLYFKPYDLTDYDWEIRTDDPGTTFSPQGPSTEDLFNGIAVTYTDLLTGAVDRLTPATNTELSDSSTTNPWNTHGISHWDEITLSKPCLATQALYLGQAALADRNRARTPGTITVRGYVCDRAGNQQPAWKVRAGDTIAITNFPNDSPRLIVETDYDDENKQIRLSIDKPFALLDAYLDRQQNALQAAGLA